MACLANIKKILQIFEVLSTSLQLYPPHDWLVASSVPSKFNPDVIEMVLKDLTPTNVRYLKDFFFLMPLY